MPSTAHAVEVEPSYQVINLKTISFTVPIGGGNTMKASKRSITGSLINSRNREAEREAETATLSQQEALAIRRRELEVRQLELAKAAATAAHETDPAKVQPDAELCALEQQKNASIKLAETKAEAERLAIEQVCQIERPAERAKEIALVESLKVEAEAESTATEKHARAAKIRAEATRAEAAAQGLAEAEVEAARVQVAEKRALRG